MKRIDTIYIGGRFVSPHGREIFELVNPATNQPIGTVRLGDGQDIRDGIASAKAAFPSFSRSTKAERIHWLQQLYDAVARREQDLVATMVEEYGGTLQFCRMSFANALNGFRTNIETLKTFDFVRTAGRSEVRLESLGVAGIITPWNASNGFICSKLGTAIAAGCTTVIKPSELSALQTQVLTECLHEAGLPAGVFNIITGLGSIAGAELTRHPDVAKISFTGSTAVGKIIARGAVDTMKRVTLELGGKSPNILLEDADLAKAIPMAVGAAFMNSGQACIAGTRLLVPRAQLNEVNALLKEVLEAQVVVGMPQEATTTVGPMVSRKQYERVQAYIADGIREGAALLVGGTGKPDGLAEGNFVKPTVFTNVRNDMRIAREEIFGPVLSVIAYEDEEDAIAIANDTDYGLQAYISAADPARALQVASRINAGRITINDGQHDPMAPFGGFRQSGIGREFGTYGMEAYLEPKAILI